MWCPSWCSSICCYNMIRNFRSSTKDWSRWTTVFLFYIFWIILWCSFWFYFISNYFWDLMQQPWLFIWILEQLLFLQVLIKRKSIKDIKDALWESLLTIFRNVRWNSITSSLYKIQDMTFLWYIAFCDEVLNKAWISTTLNHIHTAGTQNQIIFMTLLWEDGLKNVVVLGEKRGSIHADSIKTLKQKSDTKFPSILRESK